MTDSEGSTASRAFTLVVEPRVVIETAGVPTATQGVAYSTTIAAAGGTGAGYTWAISAGALPAGLVLSPTGTPGTTITGTPTEDGTFNFTVLVTDSAGTSGSRAFSLVVDAGVVAINVIETIVVSDSPGVLPSAMIGVTEQIVVNDSTAVLPSAMIDVVEQIAVSDTPGVTPSVVIGVDEEITVSDGSNLDADNLAPVLTLPAPIVAEAETPGGAVVTFSVTATDDRPGTVTVVCAPLSGALFPFNGASPTTTTVTCTATDASGNVASGAFDVVVRDTTAPQVMTAQITVAATEAAGARGNVPQAPHTPILQQIPLLAAGLDAADSSPARLPVQWVACGNPAQVIGPVADTTLYPVGTNCFSYAFRDASGNVGTGIGTIEVSPPIGGHINGPNVPVTATDLDNVPLPVTATFLALDQPGLLTAVPPQFVPSPPAGSLFVGPPYELLSTALTQAPAVVCVRPPQGDFADRLLMWEGFQWIDRTDTVDPITGEICGHPAPLGIFALARPDVPPLSMRISPVSATAPVDSTHVVEVLVEDRSNPPSRVSLRGSMPFVYEFRDPLAPSSPLSLTVETIDPGTPFAVTALIVSLGTDEGGQVISSASDVAQVINAGVPAQTGGTGLVTASTWPGTNGEGIVRPGPPAVLKQLTVSTDNSGGALRYVSAPGWIPVTLSSAAGPHTAPITAHFDVNGDGAVDPEDLVAQAEVTWIDTTPPVLTLPGSITVAAASPAGAPVAFVASAVDAISGPEAVSCTMPSGATFPVGTTPVSCTAVDASGNVGTGSFTVTVLPYVAPSVQFMATATYTRDAAGRWIATVTVLNRGNTSATAVRLTAARLNSAAGSPVPVSFGTIAANATASTQVTFPATAGSSGPANVLRLTLMWSGGSVTLSQRATLP